MALVTRNGEALRHVVGIGRCLVLGPMTRNAGEWRSGISVLGSPVMAVAAERGCMGTEQREPGLLVLLLHVGNDP